ncbi:MAG TPA: hypothetical protein VGW33_04885 [Terriglobia bacterium]|nr:hypothetical protein [Terriglobia bacterium]
MIRRRQAAALLLALGLTLAPGVLSLPLNGSASRCGDLPACCLSRQACPMHSPQAKRCACSVSQNEPSAPAFHADFHFDLPHVRQLPGSARAARQGARASTVALAGFASPPEQFPKPLL